MEEIKKRVLDKLVLMEEGTCEWDTTVALCNGETNRDKQATILASAIWQKEEAKRKLAMFAPSAKDLANIFGVTK
jgi:hypothetical protein